MRATPDASQVAARRRQLMRAIPDTSLVAARPS